MERLHRLNRLALLIIFPVAMFRNPLLKILVLLLAMSLWSASTLALPEPLVVIVNAHNPVSSLPKTAVASMYRGEELHWPRGSRIKLVNREIGSAVRERFYEKILNARADQQFFRPGTPVAVQSLIQRSDEAVIRFVATIEGAIGYVNLSSINDSVKVVYILKTDDE